MSREPSLAGRWPIPTPSETSSPTSSWFRLGIGAAALAGAGIVASDDDGLILCPFRRCTGGYCPGCGLTRSAGTLVRGDLAGSWSHHPILAIVIAQAVVLGAAWMLATDGLRRAMRQRTDALLAANTALLLAIWVARLATGQIPAPFG